jgi:hypothetical protein
MKTKKNYEKLCKTIKTTKNYEKPWKTMKNYKNYENYEKLWKTMKKYAKRVLKLHMCWGVLHRYIFVNNL